MDITPQVINEVEFRRSVRGYDLDEVDDFLERTATAVGQLLDRLHDAEQRAAVAERRLADVEAGAAPAEPGAPSPALVNTAEAETISRALIAAQRAADTLVDEARGEAERVTTAAQDQVRQLLSDAQEQAKRLVAEAETEAEHAHAETRTRVAAEVNQLEGVRDALKGDVDLLEAHFEEQRLRLRSSIDELHRLLDDPTRLRLTPAPELSGAALVGVAEPAAPRGEGEDRPDVGSMAPTDDAQAVLDEPARPAATLAGTGGAEDLRTDAPRAAAAAAIEPDELEHDWEGFGSAPTGAEGEATQSFRIDDPDTSDDAYLAELRRAMVEDADEFGPTANLFEPDPELELDPHRARSRFGRRR